MPRKPHRHVEVSEEDVNHWVNFIRRNAKFTRTQNGQWHADQIYASLSTYAPRVGTPQSDEWWRELAKKVRERLLWKGPLPADERDAEG